MDALDAIIESQARVIFSLKKSIAQMEEILAMQKDLLIDITLKKEE